MTAGSGRTGPGRVPPAVVSNAMNLGDAGARWLARLPADVEAVCRTWGVAPGATLPSSWSLVVAATAADGSGVVVKLGFPDEESAHEAEALHEYDGEGAVRLLASDGSRRALLLERVTPGDSLDQLPDERLATSHAAAVLRRLWRPPPGDHSFGSTTDLARRWAVEVPAAYEARGGPFERRLVTAAAGLLGDLVRDSGAPVLLHRDAHYANILYSGSQGWLAIDPKGLVGDRELDTVPFCATVSTRC